MSRRRILCAAYSSTNCGGVDRKAADAAALLGLFHRRKPPSESITCSVTPVSVVAAEQGDQRYGVIGPAPATERHRRLRLPARDLPARVGRAGVDCVDGDAAVDQFVCKRLRRPGPGLGFLRRPRRRTRARATVTSLLYEAPDRTSPATTKGRS